MDFDYGKAPVYILCSVLVIVGIGFIWRWLSFERFRDPEKHEDLRFNGTHYSGGWITLAQGIVMVIIGFVILFMFGYPIE